MATSTIPTVLANLYTGLAAATYPVTTQVSYGPPPSHSEERVLVEIGDTFGEGDNEQTWAVLGTLSREERYAIGLTIDVRVAGKDANNSKPAAQQAVELAFSVVAVVENYMRSNPTLGVSAKHFEAQLRQPVHQYVETDQGSFVHIPTAVVCMARI